MVDAERGVGEETRAIIAKLTGGKKRFLILNKIDLVPREKLLALAQAANERLKFVHTFMISALSGDGVDDLRRTLAAMVPAVRASPVRRPKSQSRSASP